MGWPVRLWVVACGLSGGLGGGCAARGPDPTDAALAEMARRTDGLSAQLDKAEGDATPLADRVRALAAAKGESDEIARGLDGIEVEKLKRDQFDKVRALLDRVLALEQRRKAAMQKATADLKQHQGR